MSFHKFLSFGDFPEGNNSCGTNKKPFTAHFLPQNGIFILHNFNGNLIVKFSVADGIGSNSTNWLPLDQYRLNDCMTCFFAKANALGVQTPQFASINLWCHNSWHNAPQSWRPPTLCHCTILSKASFL